MGHEGVGIVEECGEPE
ncbi:hypothetical protein O9929_18015 [Vibrio lentus]|nr:hypothetical protein [Vibrio lentus]